MEFVFDLSFLDDLAAMNPLQAWWFIFVHGGWIPVLWTLLWGSWRYWLFRIRNQYSDSIPYTFLAIDVPKNNEQTVLAVENVFSQLAGAHGTETVWDAYWHGKTQLSFSLEIVSIDGYVQFIIRTPKDFRDLAEAAIYAQYPDAEIHEIDDYVPNVPQRWPHPEWKFFGLEYKLAKPEAYPLRTYKEFEDKLSGTFKDPMAALLETMGKLQPGEQLWYQFVITPINDDWREGGEKIVDKLIQRKKEAKTTILGRVVELPLTLLNFIVDNFFTAAEESVRKEKKNEPFSIMMQLSPGEKKVIEDIQHKISKIGFRTKFRIMYIARNELYHVKRALNPVVGATKQYNTIDANRFAVQKKIWTKVYYVFTKYRLKTRQNKMMRAYRVRSDSRGAGPGSVLNIEELASLWHFPVLEVKAPLVKKTEAKRAEPPFTLPVTIPRVFRKKEESPLVEAESPKEEAALARKEPVQSKAGPPDDLPFV